mmetsp:Transcript_147861/g.474674  ORF Transcript_147861/g.474674 Transcript_147861/m.474674 type:complete len:109 (-) Transcript_147861:163-489(-)
MRMRNQQVPLADGVAGHKRWTSLAHNLCCNSTIEVPAVVHIFHRSFVWPHRVGESKRRRSPSAPDSGLGQRVERSSAVAGPVAALSLKARQEIMIATWVGTDDFVGLW